MKKRGVLSIFAFGIMLIGNCFAVDETSIVLYPGFNVVSTPARLQSVSFSNGGENISAFTMNGGKWESVAINSDTVASIMRPLQGFLISNNNTESVTMSIQYNKSLSSSSDLVHSKNLDLGWNLLGITTEDKPFETIGSSEVGMIVDFTNGSSNNDVSIGEGFEVNPTNFQLGKAYGVFLKQSGGIYGGVDNYAELSCNDILVILACLAGDESCPPACIEEEEDVCNDPDVIADCLLGDESCPMECREVEDISQIKLTNTKLGNIDVVQGAEDVVVAEGSIQVPNDVKMNSFKIAVAGTDIDSMSLVINGEEYEGAKIENEGNLEFTFSKVVIEKSTKLQKIKFLVNIRDDATVNQSILFSSIFNKTMFSDAIYLATKTAVNQDDVLGTISFSKITVQKAKAALENNLTETIKFIANEVDEKVVFDGRYSARKGDIYLNTVRIDSSSEIPHSDTIIFYVSIDDEVVTLNPNTEETFPYILVSAGESVNVNIKANIYSNGEGGDIPSFTITLEGEDQNGNTPVGTATEYLAPMKIVDPTLQISSFNTNTVLLKGINSNIVRFNVSPSNVDYMDFETMRISGDIDGTPLVANDIIVKIPGWGEISGIDDNGSIYYDDIYKEVSRSYGADVNITTKRAITGNITINVTALNEKSVAKTFKRKFVDALAYVYSSTDLDGSTKFEIYAEQDDDYTVSNFCMYRASIESIEDETNLLGCFTAELSSNYHNDLEIAGSHEGHILVQAISYVIQDWEGNSETIIINKSDFLKYFEIGPNTYLKVYGVK